MKLSRNLITVALTTTALLISMPATSAFAGAAPTPTTSRPPAESSSTPTGTTPGFDDADTTAPPTPTADPSASSDTDEDADTSHPAGVSRYTCAKSSYSAGGRHYGKARCTGGPTGALVHKAMVNCLASDGRTWVAEGPFVIRGQTSVATCGTAKVTYVGVISRTRG